MGQAYQKGCCRSDACETGKSREMAEMGHSTGVRGPIKVLYEPIHGTEAKATKDSKQQINNACGVCCRRVGFCILCTVAIVVGIFVAVYYIVLNQLTAQGIDTFLKIKDSHVEEFCGSESHLTMSNITENIWWPGCGHVHTIKDFNWCKGTCVSFAEMQAMDNFNTQHGGRLVSYNSRPGLGHRNQSLPVIRLTGWWLPAPNAKPTTPRIVLQHGYTSNSNKHRQMYAAYQLRKLGFSVLINNLRDHCYSADSSYRDRYYSWGNAYPNDVLGAWDFAVYDPDEVLGGPVQKSQVGIMGFSMGAFLTTTSFAKEPDVPGVWIDSPPFTPRSAFQYGARAEIARMGMPTFLSDLVDQVFMDPLWKNIDDQAKSKGIDLSYGTPENTLPLGADTRRPMFWVGNKDDSTVSYQDGERLQNLINTLPKKYHLFGKMENSGSCNGVDHCEDHLRLPAQYEGALCSFWTHVFKLPATFCTNLPPVPSTPQTAAKATVGQPAAPNQAVGTRRLRSE